MKKILSLILSSALVLGLFNVPELNIYAEEPKPDVQPWDNRYGPLPEGKFVMVNFGYHDTWTAEWENYYDSEGNPDIFSNRGTALSQNKNKVFDEGKPLSNQSRTSAPMNFSVPWLKSNEDFQKNFIVLPLNIDSFKNLGMTEEQAKKALEDALSSRVVGSAEMGGPLSTSWRDKYYFQGVSNFSIGESTFKDGKLSFKMNYKLETPFNEFSTNTLSPYGADLRERMMDPTTGVLANARQYKDNGWPYEQFKTKTLESYRMPVKTIKDLWDYDTVDPNVVGWRWYIPFAIYQKTPPKVDLEANLVLPDYKAGKLRVIYKYTNSSDREIPETIVKLDITGDVKKTMSKKVGPLKVDETYTEFVDYDIGESDKTRTLTTRFEINPVRNQPADEITYDNNVQTFNLTIPGIPAPITPPPPPSWTADCNTLKGNKVPEAAQWSESRTWGGYSSGNPSIRTTTYFSKTKPANSVKTTRWMNADKTKDTGTQNKIVGATSVYEYYTVRKCSGSGEDRKCRTVQRKRLIGYNITEVIGFNVLFTAYINVNEQVTNSSLDNREEYGDNLTKAGYGMLFKSQVSYTTDYDKDIGTRVQMTHASGKPNNKITVELEQYKGSFMYPQWTHPDTGAKHRAIMIPEDQPDGPFKLDLKYVSSIGGMGVCRTNSGMQVKGTRYEDYWIGIPTDEEVEMLKKYNPNNFD